MHLAGFLFENPLPESFRLAVENLAGLKVRGNVRFVFRKNDQVAAIAYCQVSRNAHKRVKG
jgi:hypothetical protein